MRASYLIALAITAAVAAWIVSGQLNGKLWPAESQLAIAPADGSPAPTPAAEPAINGVMTVRTVTRSAVERAREIRVRGQTEVSRSVVTRAEVGGKVSEIFVAKGDRVTAGQVLARLDLAERTARLAEIVALVSQRETEYEIARSLTEQGHRPTTALAAAETALESAAAALRLIQLEIEKTEIKAPFDGIIEDRLVHFGDVIGAGSPVMLIVDENPFLVAGNVSEMEIASVTVGGAGTAHFLDGRSISGVIRFVATVADPQTRTFRVELEVDNRDRTLRAGLTTDLVLSVGQTLAHFVSPAALVLDDEGQLGIKAVNTSGIVEFLPARVMAADGEGVWLDGLPHTVAIITVGHQFVRAGDLVHAVADTEAGL